MENQEEFNKVSEKSDELERPTEKFVLKYIDKFLNSHNEGFKHYPYQEQAIIKLWKEFPKNDNLIEILLKVGILNSFYSTNIYMPFEVADKIFRLNIDERLEKKDITLVKDIAENQISGKNKNFYSFATKYCSIHKPEDYPMYDSYIEWILFLYKKQYEFAKFKKWELKDYKKFIKVIREFQVFFDLEKFSFKQIDQFLWTYAKEIRPSKSNKKKEGRDG